MIDPALLLAGSIVGFVVITLTAGLIGWVLVGIRWRAGLPPLEQTSRAPLPATLADIVLIFFLLAFFQVAIAGLLRQVFGLRIEGTLSEMERLEQIAFLAMGALWQLAAAAVSMALLLWRRSVMQRGGTNAGLGAATLQERWEVWLQLRAGLMTFATVAPPVFLLQTLLATYWKPTEHPLIKLLQADPDWRLFAATGFTAVIGAPIFEEYVFRGLLQSWLERVHLLKSGDWMGWLTGLQQSDPHSEQLEDSNESRSPVSEEGDPTPPAENAAVTKEVSSVRTAPKPGELSGDDVPTKWPFWPIVVSSLLFALMHWGHGPDPIPLFFLALGLGYLYQRTRSLCACMLVHFLVNGFTMALLALQVFYGSELGLPE